MIILLKENVSEQQLNDLSRWLEEQGVSLHATKGLHQTILGLIGDTSRIDIGQVMQMEIVEDVKRVQEPFKSANRKFHPLDTVVDVNGVPIGGGGLAVIAGPCSIESREQILCVAEAVKKSGASFLRGGAFKPRTSPKETQVTRTWGGS